VEIEVFPYNISEYNKSYYGNAPSISFHAFKKSSGSENATNPYFACKYIEPEYSDGSTSISPFH